MADLGEMFDLEDELEFLTFRSSGAAPEPEPPGPGPTIENIQPNLGTAFLPETTLQLDVVRGSAVLHDVMLFALFPDAGEAEVIWDGDQFMPRYIQKSRREVLADRWRYTLTRTGKWPETPLIRVRAFDANLTPVS